MRLDLDAAVDILLRAAGLPGLDDAVNALKNVREKAEVEILYNELKTYAMEAEYLLQPAEEAAEIRLVEHREWPRGLPEPAVRIGGRLERRFTFYGLATGVLRPILLLYIAAAGAGWEPPGGCRDELGSAKGKLTLYVVPGLPCAKALYRVLPVLLCSKDAMLDAVNVETMAVQGLRPPSWVSRVPAFARGDRPVYVGVPDSFEEAARLWQG